MFVFIFAADLTAQVAKLVDALCSGRSVRKDVLVRIQSWARFKIKSLVSISFQGFFVLCRHFVDIFNH